MPRALTVTCIVIGAVMASTGCAPLDRAAESPAMTLDRVKATRTISMGYRASSVPFSFVGPDGKPTGYSVELCARVADDLRRELGLPDLEVKWVPVDVPTRTPALLNGAIDLECGSTTNTLSRQEEVDFSLTTFITGGSLLVLAGGDLEGELRNLRIAVISGTTTEGTLKEMIAKLGPGGIDLIPVKDHVDGLAAVESKTADAYASDRAILIGLVMTSRDPSRFALMNRYFSYEPYALMLRRGDPAFRLAVNRVLARLYRTGDIEDVYRRWFGRMGVPASLLVAMYAIEGLPE
ncbi:MAG: amino acid ABC transporter substrate-binding protein [Candidatus Rokuibacteriota bacterium]